MTTSPRRTPEPRPTAAARFARRAVAAAVALLLAALPVAAQTSAPGGDSPQAVVARMERAAEAEDLGEMAACLAPEDRATLTLTLVMMSGVGLAFARMGIDMGMAGAGELSEEERRELDQERAAAHDALDAAERRYEEIVKEYGLLDLVEDESNLGPDADPQRALEGVDQVALLRDLLTMLETVPAEQATDAALPVEAPPGELHDLEVEGDRATGRLGDEGVEFVRVDGRWYLSLGLGDAWNEEGPGSPSPP